MDGHFNDDYHPYVFVSEDYGQSWRPIVDGLPPTSVHRIREHPANPISWWRLRRWASAHRLTAARTGSARHGFPPVPVYDLVFQESAHALVAGTHGRSIWVLDHIEPLAEMPHADTARLFPCRRCITR